MNAAHNIPIREMVAQSQIMPYMLQPMHQASATVTVSSSCRWYFETPVQFDVILSGAYGGNSASAAVRRRIWSLLFSPTVIEYVFLLRDSSDTAGIPVHGVPSRLSSKKHLALWRIIP